jgi:UDP-N-acetylmuramoylalanine--D-glutamate ligase
MLYMCDMSGFYKKIAIIGYGVEGKSVHKFLRVRYPRSHIEIRDAKHQGESYLVGLNAFDLIVRSPGIKFLHPSLQKVYKSGKLTSLTQLFFEEVQKKHLGTIVGITGTKGKGTVATMLYRMLKASGKEAYLVGNIGKPALDILPKLNKKSFIIYELSSFQLQGLPVSPNLAIVLGISPDHLDYHKNFHEYIAAKSYIAQNQKRSESVFFKSDDKYAKKIAYESVGKKIPLSVAGFSLFFKDDIKLIGDFNYENAVFATKVAQFLGSKDGFIKESVSSFTGLPYRMQYCGKKGGVKFINDSASTTLSATAAALLALKDPVVLIAGGKSKGGDSRLLQNVRYKDKVRAVILIGENKNEFISFIPNNVFVKKESTLKKAVISAKKLAKNGDVILFSPGSASFDMFRNAKNRGADFDKIFDNMRD